MLLLNRYILKLWLRSVFLTYGVLILGATLVDGLSVLATLQSKGFEPRLAFVVLGVGSWRFLVQLSDFAIGFGTLFTIASLKRAQEWSVIVCSGYSPAQLWKVLSRTVLLLGIMFSVGLQGLLAPFASVDSQVRNSILNFGEYQLTRSAQNVWLRWEDAWTDNWVHAGQWQEDQQRLEHVTVFAMSKPDNDLQVYRCRQMDYTQPTSACGSGVFNLGFWDVEAQLLPAAAQWIGTYPSVIVRRMEMGQAAVGHWSELFANGFRPFIWLVICGFALRLGIAGRVWIRFNVTVPILAIVLSGGYLLQQLLKAQVAVGTIAPGVAAMIYTLILLLIVQGNRRGIQ